MTSRLMGALLGVLLLYAATFEIYTAAAQKAFSAALEFETSFVSRDSLDDSNESSVPVRSVDWSPRSKVVGKVIVGSMARPIKFMPPTITSCERASYSRQALQDLFRFQEVCRI